MKLKRNKYIKDSIHNQVESDMADFERSVAAMEADLDNRMAPFKPGVPSWALPQNQHKNWSITDQSLTGSSSGMRSSDLVCSDKTSTAPDKWEVSLDVQKFSPESLCVKIKGDIVTISGSQVW